MHPSGVSHDISSVDAASCYMSAETESDEHSAFPAKKQRWALSYIFSSVKRVGSLCSTTSAYA